MHVSTTVFFSKKCVFRTGASLPNEWRKRRTKTAEVTKKGKAVSTKDYMSDWGDWHCSYDQKKWKAFPNTTPASNKRENTSTPNSNNVPANDLLPICGIGRMPVTTLGFQWDYKASFHRAQPNAWDVATCRAGKEYTQIQLSSLSTELKPSNSTPKSSTNPWLWLCSWQRLIRDARDAAMPVKAACEGNNLTFRPWPGRPQHTHSLFCYY